MTVSVSLTGTRSFDASGGGLNSTVTVEYVCAGPGTSRASPAVKASPILISPGLGVFGGTPTLTSVAGLSVGGTRGEMPY